jgi:hypothetical protein
MTYENNELRHSFYRAEDPQKHGGGHILGFHTNAYNGTEFGISLQKEDRRFTARPRRAFVTIQPVGADDVVFCGHETEFELRRPVPVLHYQLVGWPKNQARARIDFSFLMSDQIGVRKVPLNLSDNTLDQPFSQEVTLKLSTTPSRNNAPVRIIVDEVHAPQSKQFPLHFVLEPQPLTARHSLARRSPQGGLEVTHVFSVEPEKLRNTEVSLQITTPNERHDTWVSVEPITVDVHHWTSRK